MIFILRISKCSWGLQFASLTNISLASLLFVDDVFLLASSDLLCSLSVMQFGWWFTQFRVQEGSISVEEFRYLWVLFMNDG